MISIKRIILPLIGFIIISASGYTALKIPGAPEGRISDYAGMLTDETKGRLEDALESYEERTGIQIAVATFPSLEGESLEDFSIRLAEKWKIGRKGKDNGVIMLIFKQEKKIRIEVGYGLEGELPDAAASMIIRNVIAPYFRNGDYDGGIIQGVSAIMKILSGGGSSVTGEGNQNQSFYTLDKQKIIKIAVIVLALLALLFIIDLIRYGGYAANRTGYGHRYSFIEWLIIFSITLAILKIIFYMALMGRSRGGFGGGRDGWGGGGGFSGGGGSFGGGGASGGW